MEDSVHRSYEQVLRDRARRAYDRMNKAFHLWKIMESKNHPDEYFFYEEYLTAQKQYDRAISRIQGESNG